MKRVLYVAHLQSHIRQFHLWYLKHLKEQGFYVAVATRVDNPEELSFLDAVYDIPFERSPLKLANFKTYRKLRTVMKQGDFEIVHCHTPVAGILTRLGSHGLDHKVYYTAHGFHFFKGAPLINWLIYFPAEFICSFMTDVLFTMNQEDYGRARKWFHHPHVVFIHGAGIDIARFKNCHKSKNDEIRLVSVGECIKRKNHILLIELMKVLPDKFTLTVAGNGELLPTNIESVKNYNLSDRVHFIGFCKDIPELLSKSDIFVFPSLQEGLPVALIESMASGLPCVVSNIRGNCDLIENGNGGYLCSNNVNSYKRALLLLSEDRMSVHKFGLRNISVANKYARDVVKSELDKWYLSGVDNEN